MFSVGVPDLVTANKLKNSDDIHAGQTLTIPSVKVTQKSPTPATESKTAKTYTVRKGDSPMKIAREHNCTYEELMKLNGIKDPKKIQTGQVLKLPVKNG
jgi:LysM repeat protein